MTCSAKGITNVAINHAAPVASFQLFANDVFTPQADKFEGFFPTGVAIIIVVIIFMSYPNINHTILTQLYLAGWSG